MINKLIKDRGREKEKCKRFHKKENKISSKTMSSMAIINWKVQEN